MHNMFDIQLLLVLVENLHESMCHRGGALEVVDVDTTN